MDRENTLFAYEGMTPDLGERVFIAPHASVIVDVSVGEDSSIWFNAVVRGDVHYISIGKRVSIQDGSAVHVTHYKKEDRSDGSPTIIEDDVTVGHKVILHGCTIKKACLIGMGAIILDDAVIGEESIVGAGAMVTKGKKFPPRSLILGSPAKVVRELREEELEELYASAKRYVGFKDRYLK